MMYWIMLTFDMMNFSLVIISDHKDTLTYKGALLIQWSWTSLSETIFNIMRLHYIIYCVNISCAKLCEKCIWVSTLSDMLHHPTTNRFNRFPFGNEIGQPA